VTATKADFHALAGAFNHEKQTPSRLAMETYLLGGRDDGKNKYSM
jgi:hypothetical protein